LTTATAEIQHVTSSGLFEVEPRGGFADPYSAVDRDIAYMTERLDDPATMPWRSCWADCPACGSSLTAVAEWLGARSSSKFKH